MTVVTWKPAYRAGEPTISELLDLKPALDMAYVLLEDGSKRWIPAHWIEETS